MSGELSGGEMRIGEVLKQARARAGLDIRTVEERTKIRVKYLRALEDEEWDALPNPAYAKGFLRTYAQLLGLDGEALADAYRRQVEGGRAETYPLGEQVLERRRRLADERDGPPWLLILAAAVIVVAGVLLAIGLLGGDEEDGTRRDRASGEQERKRDRDQGEVAASGTVALSLVIREPVQICLLGGGGEELIDGQVLNVGDEESFERKRFELRFPGGFATDQFRLEIAGKPRLLPKADGPAAYEIIAPRRVIPAEPPGKECP